MNEQAEPSIIRLWQIYDETAGGILCGPPERKELQFWLPRFLCKKEILGGGLVRLTIPRDLAEEMKLP